MQYIVITDMVIADMVIADMVIADMVIVQSSPIRGPYPEQAPHSAFTPDEGPCAGGGLVTATADGLVTAW